MGKRKKKAGGKAEPEPDNSAPQSKLAVQHVPLLGRIGNFLTTPSWLGFATWLGVISAIVFSAITYRHENEKEKDAAERALSRIDYAWFIKPAPYPGEEFERTARWEISVMVPIRVRPQPRPSFCTFELRRRRSFFTRPRR
jgi:hypothetical protein